MNTHLIDTSSALQVCRVNNGITLVRPGQKNIKKSIKYRNTSHTISSLFNLPICVYFSDANGICQNMNEPTLIGSGFDSIQQARGKTLHEVLTPLSVSKIKQNDHKVMKFDTVKIFEENSIRKDNLNLDVLSIKLPWYDNHHKIIGLMGCSIIFGKQLLAESLEVITKLGFLNLSENSFNLYTSCKNRNINLSNREYECIHLLARGFTAKAIANELNLSPRTVENYIANIKSKLNVSTKNELIRKIFESEL